MWSSTAPASCNHRHLKDEALRGVVLCLLDTGHGRTAIEAVKIESCFLLCTGRFWKILQEDQDSIITWRLNYPKCISFLCTWIKPLGGRQAPAGLRLSYGTSGSCVMWCNGGQEMWKGDCYDMLWSLRGWSKPMRRLWWSSNRADSFDCFPPPTTPTDQKRGTMHPKHLQRSKPSFNSGKPTAGWSNACWRCLSSLKKQLHQPWCQQNCRS